MLDKQLKQNNLERIGVGFKKELTEIQDEIYEKGTKKVRPSIRKITELIKKHNSWPLIKEEIVEYLLEDE